MKAVLSNNNYFEITGERGDFFVCKDAKGKVKMFAKKDVKVEEIESMPKTRKFNTKKVVVKADPIKTWQDIAMSVNNKWNENNTWKLAEQAFGRIDAKGDTFIQSLLDSMFTNGRLSEKQAYCLAKFGVESGQLN